MEFLLKTERDVVNAALKGSPSNIYEDEGFHRCSWAIWLPINSLPSKCLGYDIRVGTTGTFPKTVLDDINMATRSRRLKTAPFV